MFEDFFRFILEKLFGSGFTFEKILEQLPLQRFTEKAIVAIRLAQNESRRLGHQYVGTEQILLGLIGEGSVASQFLTSVGVNFENTQIEVEKIIGRGRGIIPAEIPFTPRAKLALEHSVEEAHQLRHNYVGTEHLLLGVLHQRDGLAARVLQNLGVDLENLEQRIRAALT